MLIYGFQIAASDENPYIYYEEAISPGEKIKIGNSHHLFKEAKVKYNPYEYGMIYYEVPLSELA